MRGRRMPAAVARRAAFAVALVLAALAAPPAEAEEARRLGVVVVLTVNATEERAAELAEALGAAIADELAVEVIVGAAADAALASADLPDGCVADEVCVRELGERLDVDEILALVVVELGETIQIEPTWVDVDSGKTASRAAMAFEREDDPSELFRRRAPKLVPDAPRRAPAADADGEREDAADDMLAAEDGGGEAVRRRMTPAAWTAAGVGAASLGGGLGFWLATRSLYLRCDRERCPKQDGPRISRRALAADALVTTAVISGGVAAALYWFSGSGGERELHVGPGPTELGLSLGGRF